VPNGSLAESLNGKLHQLFVALILAWVVLNGFRPVMNNVDLGWHVAQGRWMTEHAAIYARDAMNYPNLGHRAVNEYPLFQVVLYAAWSLGWWGPCLLTSLAYALLVGLLIRAGRFFDPGTSALPALAIGLMLSFFQVAAPLRPHLATYLGVVTLGIFLLRHRDAAGWTVFWPMALLQIAWTNCHSGFVLGPAMVGLFGAEMIARRLIAERCFPWEMLRTWSGSFLLMLLACFVNPFGWERFYPPFYQDQLESIRAYVGEMEPLGGVFATIYADLTLIAVVVVAAAVISRRGAISFSFLLLAIFFYHEAGAVQKAWPVFGLFVPLLVLSSTVFSSSSVERKPAGWASVFGHGAVTVLAGIALVWELDPSWPTSLPVQWREYDRGRSELSVEATVWMKANGVEGRLFHRCEDGGWLQEEGYDHGETFSDTGFGKYDEAFIHEVGLVNERPALVPRYLEAYRSDFVVCSTFCYQWPYYLKEEGYRLIFYSPNSSVWARPGVRPDLPAVPDDAVAAAFSHDIAVNGMPVDLRLFGRNLIALQSMGLEDFVMATMKALPDNLHHDARYWEAARFICFSEPAASDTHRQEFLDEAEQLHDDPVTAEFRAYAHQAAGDTDGALRILEAIPKNGLGNYGAELLLKIYLDQKRPEALALAQRTDCFDLRNGRHWQYLAQAEDEAGHREAAAGAWARAVFYYPDDVALMEAASAFAVRENDAELSRAITESSKVYGVSTKGN
jgi:tetratricopeptide (TPR) repeat protein